MVGRQAVIGGMVLGVLVAWAHPSGAQTDERQALRAQVEASLRKLSGLIDEINRKWPLERDTGVRLP